MGGLTYPGNVCFILFPKFVGKQCFMKILAIEKYFHVVGPPENDCLLPGAFGSARKGYTSYRNYRRGLGLVKKKMKYNGPRWSK